MLRTIGVVLAGGSSDRMGRPKVTLKLPNGQTFLQRALALLSKLTDMQIVADGKEEISDGIHFPQLHICDLHPGEGPLAGIEAALATRFGSGYIIIACDQPRLDKAILKRLVGGHPDRIHAFEVGGDIVPLPLYVPQSAWGVMVKVMQGDNRSIRHFIEAGKYKLIPLLASEAPLLQSVNTPEEYQELLAELTAPTSGMQTLTREILP